MLIIRWIWLDKLDQILWIFSCVFEVYASVWALVCVFLSSSSFSYHSFLFSAFHTKNYYSLNWHQENLNTQVLKMPYKDENESMAMFISLPDHSPSAMDVLLDKLSPEILDDVFNRRPSSYGFFHEDDVLVSLPKFSLENSCELSPVSWIWQLKVFP